MRVSIAIFILLLPYLGVGQNAIPNPSFEHGYDWNPGQYGEELFGLREWENFSSSDWFHTGDAEIIIGTSPPANTGDAYIGFGPCEGAQVKLDKTQIDQTSLYYYMESSLYYRMRMGNWSQFNYYILKDKEREIEDCKNDGSFSDGVKVTHTIDNGQDDKWYLHENTIGSGADLPVIKNNRSPNDEFEWFAIKGRNKPGQHSNDEYMYIDDVNVTFHDYCDHPCTFNENVDILAYYAEEQDNGDIIEYYDPDIINGASKSVTNVTMRLMDLVNVNYVLMRIVNRWGQVQETEWFDYRGLTNARWKHDDILRQDLNTYIKNRDDLFTVLWDGRLNGDGNSHDDPYTVYILAKNCWKTVEATFVVIQLGDEMTQQQPHYFEPKVFDNSCCTSGNKRYNSEFLYYKSSDNYQDHIVYDSGFSFGPNRSYKGQAGNYLEMRPNSSANVDPGHYFELRINQFCTLGEENNGEGYNGSEGKKGKKIMPPTHSKSDFIQVYPNPVKDGLLYFDSPMDVKEIQLYSLDGKIMPFSRVDNAIRLDNYSSGIYMVKFITNEETIIKKFIVE